MLEKLPEAVGRALRDRRAGLEKIVFNALELRTGMAAITVTSLAFEDHAPIPARYTADGEGLSPPLQWLNLPPTTASVVLMVEDADAPTPNPLVHAIVVGIAPDETGLPESAIASPNHEGSGLSTGRNSFLDNRWLPPDPPPGHGVHRYAFQIFALRHRVEFSEIPGREEVLDALRESAIASGLLIGTYVRSDGSIKEDAAEAIGISVTAPPLTS